MIIEEKEFLPDEVVKLPVDAQNAIMAKVTEVVDDSIAARFQEAYDYIKEQTDAIVKDIKDFAAPLIELYQEGVAIAAVVQEAAEDLNQLNKDLQNIVADINNVIQGGWGSVINLALNQVGLSISDGLGTFNFYAKIFSFGDDEPDFTGGTAKSASLLQNQQATKLLVQSSALQYAVRAVNLIEFETDEQLLSISDQIYAQFDKVIALPLIDIQTINLIKAQRTQFTEYIEQQKLQVLKVTEVQVVNESLTTLVYSYYGDLENFDLIQSLNGFVNPSLINGTVKIATG